MMKATRANAGQTALHRARSALSRRSWRDLSLLPQPQNHARLRPRLNRQNLDQSLRARGPPGTLAVNPLAILKRRTPVAATATLDQPLQCRPSRRVEVIGERNLRGRLVIVFLLLRCNLQKYDTHAGLDWPGPAGMCCQ